MPETKECVFHSDISVTSDSVSVKLAVKADNVVLHVSACSRPTQNCSSNVEYLVIHILGFNGTSIGQQNYVTVYCSLFF